VTLLDHFEAIEADFRRFYHLRLSSELWGPNPMTAREVSVLIRTLPAEAALISRDLVPEHRNWGNTEELLALLIEQEHATWRLLLQVHSKEGAEIPEPLRIPRPWTPSTEPEPRRQATTAQVASFFGAAVIVVPKEDSEDAR
jgi:hypothetical protein